MSPSLVEAAARAVYASFPPEDMDENDPEQFETCLRDTRTALETVGDALRLEGAQAEHARLYEQIEPMLLALRSAASSAEYESDRADLLALFAVLDDLGGVHPEVGG